MSLKLDYQTWATLKAKSLEMTLRNGKRITIKELIAELVQEKYDKS